MVEFPGSLMMFPLRRPLLARETLAGSDDPDETVYVTFAFEASVAASVCVNAVYFVTLESCDDVLHAGKGLYVTPKGTVAIFPSSRVAVSVYDPLDWEGSWACKTEVETKVTDVARFEPIESCVRSCRFGRCQSLCERDGFDDVGERRRSTPCRKGAVGDTEGDADGDRIGTDHADRIGTGCLGRDLGTELRIR